MPGHGHVVIVLQVAGEISTWVQSTAKRANKQKEYHASGVSIVLRRRHQRVGYIKRHEDGLYVHGPIGVQPTAERLAGRQRHEYELHVLRRQVVQPTPGHLEAERRLQHFTDV